MTNIRFLARSACLTGLIALAACVVAVPREGDFDRDHHRYYRDHEWHECVEHDEHCR
jgi:hypothetical protein